MKTHFRLLEILADGRFHSGQRLASQLGVTRSGIWKAVGALRQQGLEVHAVSGRGYCLAFPFERLNRQTIHEELDGNVRDWLSHLDVLWAVDSTNNYLMRFARESDSALPRACVAESQSSGRGRHGRHWVSPLGRNLYLSLLIESHRAPAMLSALPLAVGLSVVQLIEQYGVHGIGIKWPNDIYYRGAKLGGVLMELVGDSTGPCRLVIGIGLNVYMLPEEGKSIDQAWTSLQTMGLALSRNLLVSRVINEVHDTFHRYERYGFEPFMSQWRRCDILRGRQVTLQLHDDRISGQVEDVDASGALLLQTSSGLGRYLSGDVSVRLN